MRVEVVQIVRVKVAKFVKLKEDFHERKSQI